MGQYYNSQKSRGFSRGGGRGRGGRSNYGRFSGNTIHESFFIKKADEIIEEEAYVSEMKFETLDINAVLKQNILKKGYTNPTPIQDKAIIPALQGKDVVGVAKTGSGKTAAFLIPIINKILANPSEKALIIVPTRELAVQISVELKSLAQGTSINSVVCIGGTGLGPQIKSLRYPHNFIIATPGRIKDLIERRAASMQNVKYVVLDEVDRMFDMGFGKDVAFLVDKVPTPRQNFFFSATLSSNIEQLFAKYLVNPIKIDIKTTDGINTIEQDIVRIPKAVKKIDILHDLLIKEGFNKVLVFGRTKHGVKDTHQELVNRGFKADSIHGNKTQAQRQKSLNAFKENKVNILVATDVAARGIDVMDITHVINFDIPATKEDYTHRIGRTGRANKKGTALTFVE
ncbi:DEAD/DEAH box helicase [bacterium]|nr:DEAD/DEAH box helicase [bacterium]